MGVEWEEIYNKSLFFCFVFVLLDVGNDIYSHRA